MRVLYVESRKLHEIQWAGVTVVLRSSCSSPQRSRALNVGERTSVCCRPKVAPVRKARLITNKHLSFYNSAR